MAKFSTADVERERPDEDFEVECASGNTYKLPHPKSVPGRDLIEMDPSQPAHVFAILLGDDFDAFIDEPEIDGYALDAIMTAWIEHYGLEVNRGNAAASRRSSSGTARKSKRTSRSAASR
jgi:hypothetical protein